jgi:dUTP pyrophosphatase
VDSRNQDTESYAQAGVVYQREHCIHWQRLHEDAVVPLRKTPGAAGLDLHLIADILIPPGRTMKARTGLAMALPVGTVGFIKPRSSAFGQGLDLDGTIDSDYRGEVLLQIRNTSSESVHLKKGDRVAQLVVANISMAPSIEVRLLDSTARGAGGFGSTGK